MLSSLFSLFFCKAKQTMSKIPSLGRIASPLPPHWVFAAKSKIGY